MKKSLLLISFFLFLSYSLSAQQSYWVWLADKEGSTFDPYTYFDDKAIERRLQLEIDLYDISDYPVSPLYLEKISAVAVETGFASRWFNCVAIKAEPEQLLVIEKFPFVKEITEMESFSVLASAEGEFDTILSSYQQKLLKGQLEEFGPEAFREAGATGKGIRIAIFDAGFPGVDTSPVFEHIRKEKRIIKTWDFAKNKEFVYSYNSHGTNVFSCIAGKVGEKQLGLAVDADFLLARTEINREPFSEEKNWLAAMEWADKNGAQIINSSLGYTHHRYFPDQMDGKTSLVSRAANMAARKGILVVNAAGNDGDGKWYFIGAPADADSVLSVGGVDHSSKFHTSFSSYGPTVDKRMKPNVCAYGHVIASGKNGLNKTQGTSFSSPLVAGFAACAWQLRPELSNMQMFEEIQKSANLYPYYDYAHGYGIPQASYFVNMEEEVEAVELMFNLFEEEDAYVVTIDTSLLEKIDTEELEANMYYHIQGTDKSLKRYYIVSIFRGRVLEIPKQDLLPGEVIRVHWNGATDHIVVK